MSADIAAPVKTGHPIGFWFFFWGEFAERCSYYGMRAILALYMTEKLGIDKSNAGTYMSLFIAACYFFPLIGGFIADNFLGKYWTIVGFSVPYVVAQFLVGIENNYIVFATLVLLAMGSGVIKPNISTLMGMTYDQQRPGLNQLRTSAFSWFYMAINIGAALSQFFMPVIRTSYGYQVAFLFPAGLMAMALVVFALGKRFYAKETIERRIIGNPNDAPPASTKTVTGIPVTYKYVTPEQKKAESDLKWKTLGRIGALFLTVMFFWAIFDQSASTWIFFADTYMESTIFGERVDGTTAGISGATCKSIFGSTNYSMSADAIQFFNPVFIVLFVPISVWMFKTLDKRGFKVKATQKMIVGFFLTGLSMVIMAFAGNLAGKKQDELKLTLTEGVVILTKDKFEVDKAEAKDGKLVMKLAGDSTMTINDWEYDKDKKKAKFSSATLAFADGKLLVVEKGRIDFAKSRWLFEGEKANVPTALETVWKRGEYTIPGGKLVVDHWNKTVIEPNQTAKPIEDKETPKVTLEDHEWVKPEQRVTVWWQILAFLIITWAEILISVTGLELAFVAAPPTMKSFVTACWLAVVFLANLLINAPITRLYPKFAPALYFGILAGAMLIVIVVFIPIASRFNKAMAEQAKYDAEKKA